MHYHVYIATERKEAILDPQGKATQHALGSLGMNAVTDARIGKFIRLSVEASTPADAETIAKKASEELLSNPIMETFRIIETKQA